jgi:hypothetical protein
MMTLPATDAKTLAMDFLMKDLDIPAVDQDFFCIVSTRENRQQLVRGGNRGGRVTGQMGLAGI